MSRWDTRIGRSLHTQRRGVLTLTAGRIARVVGRALGMDEARRAGRSWMEHLEPRQLLDGSFASPVDIALDVNGLGSQAAAINPAQPTSDNDYFRFVMPGANGTTNFVSILADTRNEGPTGSPLDTKVTIYDSTDTVNALTLGTNNGQLTTGLARDGWAGFVGTAGHTYFVIVSSDSSAGTPVAGSYTLRVGAGSTTFDIDTDSGVGRQQGSEPPPLAPRAIGFTLTRFEEDKVFKYVVPTDTNYETLATFNAEVTQAVLANRLDSRLDIYRADSNGLLTRVTFDSDAGRLNDAFTTLKTTPGETIWVRVRSDEIRPTAPTAATGKGTFYLVLDGRANDLPATLNPVTRRGSDAGGAFAGFRATTNPAGITDNPPTFQEASYTFTSLGTGLTIITAVPTGLSPVTNPALRLYDATGTLVASNDNFAGLSAEIQAQLVGGQKYYVVIDGFDVNNGVQYQLFVESNHTFSATQGVDDHVNDPTNTQAGEALRRSFEQATALIFDDPFATLDADGNVIRDRALRQTATGTGRLWAQGDSDLYQFTAPVDMLGTFQGNNDDLGTSLFVGGRFEIADPTVARPTTSRTLSNFDAGDWWYTGRQDLANGVQFGFTVNSAASGRPEIYAQTDWDSDPTTDPTDGTTDHFLIVGGNFRLTFPGALGPVTVQNIAAWGWNPLAGKFQWFSLGNANAPVRALTVFDPQGYDPDGSGADVALPDPGDNFIVAGGDFTTIGGTPASRIAFLDPAAGAWAAIGAGITGANASVRSLQVYDPTDAGSERAAAAGPPVLQQVNDPPDAPPMLFVGGHFTTAGTIASQNLAAWSGQSVGVPDQVGVKIGRWNIPNFGSGITNTKPTWSINGDVNAMTVMDVPDLDAGGPFDGGVRLIVAGAFTQIGGTATSTVLAGGAYNGIAMFGRKAADSEPNMDQQVNDFRPRLVWDPMGTGITGGAVETLTTWKPADALNIPLILVAGGAFNTAGGAPAPNVGLWVPDVGSTGDVWFSIAGGLGAGDGTGALTATGDPGSVHSLVAFADEQEPTIPKIAGQNQPALYIGGEFAVFEGTGAGNVLALAFDPNQGVFAFFTLGQGQGGGVANADPNEATPSAVFSMATFQDKDPTRWDRHSRPSSSIQIVAAPDSGGFEDLRVRIYDSNFNLIYTNLTINPLGVEPTGVIDPSLTGGALPNAAWTLPASIWGGETYYVAVDDANGGGTGRYSFNLTVDAMPTATIPQVNGAHIGEVTEGNFNQATLVTTALNDGVGDLTVGANANPFPSQQFRQFVIEPSTPELLQYTSDIGTITTIDDTDLWRFRAEFTGTVELRVQTREITDLAAELITNLDTGQLTVNPLRKTYNSALDSALRVFDNDFNQIAYNNENFAQVSEIARATIGTFTDGEDLTPPFYRRDARVVINVVAGNTYFMQVESGQRYKDGSPSDPAQRVPNESKEVDWRRVAGGYDLIVKQMPYVETDVENGQTIQDDYYPGPNQAGGFDATHAAPIPVGDVLGDANNGKGSITGVINDTPNNADDWDDFQFRATGSGQIKITVSRNGVNSLTAGLFVFIPTGAGGQTVQGTAGANGSASAVIDVLAGQLIGVRVVGNTGTEGAYRIDIAPSTPTGTGMAVRDDYADESQFWNAQTVTLRDFLGSGTIDGEIEQRGDTDVFRFSVVEFAQFGVHVHGLNGFDPQVTVYEVQEDPSGNPYRARVAFNDNVSGANPDAQVTFPVGPNRRLDPPLANPARFYDYYYVLVKASDVDAGLGDYTLSVTFPPTDDHPDAPLTADPLRDTSEYVYASGVAIDPSVGTGSATGLIERAGDTDLFIFTAPASGQGTVTITRPGTSLLRSRVVILADTAAGLPSVTIASAVSPDSAVDGTATISFTVSRGVRYFVVVEGFGPPNANTALTGAYNVAVQAPPIDDYPNATEWTLAHPVLLNATTGVGTIGGDAAGDPLNARISPTLDSDLFKVTSLANGTLVFQVNSFGVGGGNGFAPRVSVYGANQVLLQQVAATGAGQQVTVTVTGVTANTLYYVLVDAVSGISGAPTTGEYRLRITGNTVGGGTGGGGPDPSTIDFQNPDGGQILLDTVTGAGQKDGAVDTANDRDLFYFDTYGFTGPGTTTVQIVTPNGSLLDATVRILKNPNELAISESGFDADGIPGATASSTFEALPNHRYYVVVDGVGTSIGTYSVRVSSRPSLNYLYFPEGFAGDAITSFVALTNPNNVSANFTIRARYELGSFETVLATGTLGSNGSLRQQISGAASLRPAGLVTGVPFALVVESDVALGATFTHTDFSGSLGESFSNALATSWNFARVERVPGGNLDFVLLYNPAPYDVDVTLTAYQAGTAPVAVTWGVGAQRRGGLSINDLASFPRGVFSAILSVTPHDPAFASSFQGVVASISHYDLVVPRAFAALGDQGGTVLSMPSFTQGSQADSQIVLFNPGLSAATVTLTGSYIRAALPGLSRTFSIQPKSQIVLAGSSLGLVADQPIGLRVNASSAVSGLSTQKQLNEMDAAQPGLTAGTRFFFGDAFLNTFGAGNLYFQTLNLYNPAAVSTSVSVKLNFSDGTTSTITMALAARGYAELRLHERSEILSTHSGDVLFAIDATSTTPFFATLTGYDLQAHSGWTIGGVPFGLTNLLSTI